MKLKDSKTGLVIADFNDDQNLMIDEALKIMDFEARENGQIYDLDYKCYWNAFYSNLVWVD